AGHAPGLGETRADQRGSRCVPSESRGTILFPRLRPIRVWRSGRAGGVVQGVNPGQITLERTVGAVAGGAIPITSHLRVRAEVRYIVTHDVDPKPGRGTATEVSGHRGNIPVGRSSAHTWTRNSSRFSSA